MKKLKRWLIHKLGGYTEDERVAERHVIERENIPISNIIFEKRIPRHAKPHEIGRELYYQQEILSEFTTSLLKSLIESRFVDFYLCDDYFTDSIVLRGVTRICVPRDPMSLAEAIHRVTEHIERSEGK